MALFSPHSFIRGLNIEKYESLDLLQYISCINQSYYEYIMIICYFSKYRNIEWRVKKWKTGGFMPNGNAVIF